MLTSVSISINPSVYLKDPESSDLGRRIVESSIEMIDELGFEHFTFRKLGAEIGSTEASIYRYFESKHMLLIYLTSWYWGWVDYRMSLAISNIASAEERLERAIRLITEEVTTDSEFSHIDEIKLNSIIINESSKSYLNKMVDKVNKEGAFLPYKQLVARLSDIVLEINPDYKYPHMLLSTVVEGSHLQRFFAEHLPRLTDFVEGEDAISEFYVETVFKAISK